MTGYFIEDTAKADLLDIWNYILRRSVDDADKTLMNFTRSSMPL